MEESTNTLRTDKWFERLDQLRSFLQMHKCLPSPCSELGRWISLQQRAFDVDILHCKGLLQTSSVNEAFCLLRQEYYYLFMTEKEQWENTFFSKLWREVLGF